MILTQTQQDQFVKLLCLVMQRRFLLIRILVIVLEDQQDFLPSCPVYAILDNPKSFRQLGLSWNIYPKLYNKQGSIEALVSHSIKDLKAKGELNLGDVIVISGGGKILKEDKADEFKFNKTLGGIMKIQQNIFIIRRDI